MIKEVKESIFHVLRQRLTSPVSGSFLVSWIVCNWRLLYYLTSGDATRTTIQKIEYIDNHFLGWQLNVWLPTMFACIVVLFYPLLTTAALYVSLQYLKLQNWVRNKVLQSQLLSVEQSTELIEKNDKIEAEYSAKLIEKDEEIVRLKQRVNLLEQMKTQLSSSAGNERLDVAGILSHPAIDKEKLGVIITTIQRDIAISRSRSDSAAIALLESNGYIKKVEGAGTYRFTETGDALVNEYLKENTLPESVTREIKMPTISSSRRSTTGGY